MAGLDLTTGKPFIFLQPASHQATILGNQPEQCRASSNDLGFASTGTFLSISGSKTGSQLFHQTNIPNRTY